MPQLYKGKNLITQRKKMSVGFTCIESNRNFKTELADLILPNLVLLRSVSTLPCLFKSSSKPFQWRVELLDEQLRLTNK